ncbi:MAG: colonic acid production protein [Sphingobacteriales bacterium]|nr:colonic acid production protein [Sphingobacteriales bacterium]
MKILMVCLGNICRSPLAHGIMEHLAKKNNLDWEIDSAGTGNWFSGELPDSRSISIARQNGIDISTQVCRQIQVEDFDIYDRIYVMDYKNLNDVIELARDNEDRKKVKLLLLEGIVPDPYYNDEQFEVVYNMIYKRCLEIVREEMRS